MGSASHTRGNTLRPAVARLTTLALYALPLGLATLVFMSLRTSGGGETGAKKMVALRFGSDTVLYRSAVPNDNGRVLGRMLTEFGYFTNTGREVRYTNTGETTVITFALKDGLWNDRETVFNYEQLGLRIGLSEIGLPLRLRLTDPLGRTQRELGIGRFTVGTRDTVFYFGSATQADAQALGFALKSGGYFLDEGASALLSKEDGTMLTFLVDSAAWAQQETLDGFQTLARNAATFVGGLPITMRLLDPASNTDKDFEIK